MRTWFPLRMEKRCRLSLIVKRKGKDGRVSLVVKMRRGLDLLLNVEEIRGLDRRLERETRIVLDPLFEWKTGRELGLSSR